MSKPLSKTALKFLSVADCAHGTHLYNLKGYFGTLDDGGYVAVSSFPFVKLTDKGREALAPYYAEGGLPDGKRRKVG